MDRNPGPSTGNHSSRGNRGFRSNRFPFWKRGKGGTKRGGQNGKSDSNENGENNEQRERNSKDGSKSKNYSGRGRKDKSNQESIPSKKKLHLENVSTAFSNQLERKFPGFGLYFSSAETNFEDFEEKVEVICNFLKQHAFGSREKVLQIQDKEFIEIPYGSIINDALFLENWQTFYQNLIDKPMDVLNLFGLSMHRIVRDVILNEDESPVIDEGEISTLKTEFDFPKINVCIMKMEPLTSIKSIKSSLFGKYVTIRGAVVRTGSLKPLCTEMTFLCSSCEMKFAVQFKEGRFSAPTFCKALPDCEGKHFIECYSDKRTKTIDSQRIRVQDIQQNEVERGSVPKTMDCYLYKNLLNLCNAGDVVTICGIVKMSDESGNKNDNSLHQLFIEVIGLKSHKDSERTMGGNWFSFTNMDYYAVKEIHDTENLFRLLVHSLCPSIFGLEMVKAGLLLCLLGGTNTLNSNKMSRRPDINVLIVGDPGLGKSQLMKVVSEISPRGVYICGNGSTIAGLTVSLVRDGDDYSLEAGALVMSDKGTCCIDEFDKMPSQHNALLEAMEQQSVSIAKSGVYRTLPVRTSVIAAANPVGGHYDKTKTVAENIQINPALLSRFDLIFILLDKPDEEFDRCMVNHLTGIKFKDQPQSSEIENMDEVNEDQNIPLKERLKLRSNEKEIDLIPINLIRKYIAYAKQYVKPSLSPEASSILKEYYLNLRAKHRSVDSTPVTTRQLESLIRMTEARAKVELREIATAEDANDILEIFEFSMSGVFDDDNDVNVALSMASSFLNVSSRTQTKNQAKKLVTTLQMYAERQCKNIFTVNEIKTIGDTVGIVGDILTIISALNNEGFLLKKGPKVYQLQSIEI